MKESDKRLAGKPFRRGQTGFARKVFRRGILAAITAHSLRSVNARKLKRKPDYNILTMAKYKLEYLWLDGYEPVPNLRGKTQIKEFNSFPKLEELPWWGFDGSSTRQAEGKSSDCMLKPVAVFPDSTKKNGALVMCEVYMPDKKTPHPSNSRATILDDPDAWFGFEQEYFL